MSPELRQFIEQAQFCRAVVQRVAELLPPEEAELDGVIAETVRENNPKSLLHVLVAAVGGWPARGGKTSGDRGDAAGPCGVAGKHPDEGARGYAGASAGGHGKQPLQTAHLGGSAAGDSRLVPRTVGGKIAGNVFFIARRLARVTTLPPRGAGLFDRRGVADQDAGLLALVRGWLPKAKPEKRAAVEKAAQALGEAFLQSCRLPILDLVSREDQLHAGAGRHHAPGGGEDRPLRNRIKHPHFLKFYLRGNSVTFQAQPPAQTG
jgi:hypothetical protein